MTGLATCPECSRPFPAPGYGLRGIYCSHRCASHGDDAVAGKLCSCGHRFIDGWEALQHAAGRHHYSRWTNEDGKKLAAERLRLGREDVAMTPGDRHSWLPRPANPPPPRSQDPPPFPSLYRRKADECGRS